MPIIYTSGSAVDPSRTVAGNLFFDKPYNLAELVVACERFMIALTVTAFACTDFPRRTVAGITSRSSTSKV